jgi:hypothetical protein
MADFLCAIDFSGIRKWLLAKLVMFHYLSFHSNILYSAGIVRLRVDVWWMTMFCSSTSPRCGSVEVPKGNSKLWTIFFQVWEQNTLSLLTFAKLEYWEPKIKYFHAWMNLEAHLGSTKFNWHVACIHFFWLFLSWQAGRLKPCWVYFKISSLGIT